MNNIKLAILVVYLVQEEDGHILDIHLNYIKKNTHIPYTIYGYANRLVPKFIQKLEQEPTVKLCDCKPTELRGATEHGFYLEQLLEFAIADDNTHICTLDLDSFPIRSDWVEYLASKLSESCPLTGILRVENGDKVLTHPSCILFRKDFFLKYKPMFFTFETPEYKQFLQENNQRPDTGIGYSYTLYKNNLSWYKMLRSNKAEDHYLVGGVYDDIIFHLGSASRVKDAKLTFNKYSNKSKLRKLMVFMARRINKDTSAIANRLESLGVKMPTSHKLLRKIEEIIYKQTTKKNIDVVNYVKLQLLERPESYIDYLRTGIKIESSKSS